MDQSWMIPEEQPSQENPDNKYGVWFWIREALLLPCRGGGLLCFLALVFGSFLMWKLPTLAKKKQIDTSLLVLRIIDDESPVRPFRRLNYETQISAGLIPLGPKSETS